MKNAFIFLLFLVASASCTPLSKIELKSHGVTQTSEKDFTKFSGVYKNQPDTVEGHWKHTPYAALPEFAFVSLLEQLFGRTPNRMYRLTYLPTEVHLHFETARKFSVRVYQNDSLVFTRYKRGHFKNGYFYVRPRIYIYPLPPLVMGHNFERARLGLSTGGLIMNYSVNRWGFALVAGSEDKAAISAFYRKTQ